MKKIVMYEITVKHNKPNNPIYPKLNLIRSLFTILDKRNPYPIVEKTIARVKK
ncbi:hypothetical protein OAH88_00165 [Candidatus Pelagibacter sp.]|nr:hypothetical protein [Candidatus Pelagibacter sp.]